MGLDSQKCRLPGFRACVLGGALTNITFIAWFHFYGNVNITNSSILVAPTTLSNQTTRSPNNKKRTANPWIKLAICGTVKDEAPYLAEWIEHHKSIGFDHLLLYDDHSTDDTQCVLDAYAQKGYVTRVPEDIESHHMKNLPWIHPGQIRDNPQIAIFEACRRYLVDYERNNSAVGSTWMLTSDIDEFVWFDRQRVNAKKSFSQMLSALSPKKGKVKSVRIPTCVFGPSGNEAFESDLVMKRFTRRHGDWKCDDENGLKFETRGKSISLVSSVSQFFRPEEHSLANGQKNLEQISMKAPYMRLAHYMTKSREEFYTRVCSSRYFFKYFTEKKHSPEYFVSYVDSGVKEDDRMTSFAAKLELKISNTTARCNTKFKASQCPNSSMKMLHEEGYLQLLGWRTSQMPFKPLVFGAAVGINTTHSMFHATCELQLRSLNYDRRCGFGRDPDAPLPGFLAHLRLVRAHKALVYCISASHFGNQLCPSVQQTFDTIRWHIDQVISSRDVGAIHGTPYQEFADYVIIASENIRGTKPIILLGTQDPRDWAHAEGLKEDLFCKLKMADGSGLEQNIGQNLYWCLKVALQNGSGDKSITDAFHSIKHHSNSSETLASILGDGMHMYQTKMKDISQYHADFPGPKWWSQLPLDIDATTELNRAVQSVGHVPKPPHDSFQGFDHVKERLCMSSWKIAFTSGRRCDKLVLFLNFRGSNAYSIVTKLRSQGLVYNLRTNTNQDKFPEIQPGNNIDIPNSNKLRIRSSSNKSRVSDSKFWGSLYARGLDFVSLEDNFVAPDVSLNFSYAFIITQLRNPQDRFLRSAYERECVFECSKWDTSCKEDETKCLANNSFKKWMFNGIEAKTTQTEEEWQGTLYPNYYIRMLNGMADFPRDTLLTRNHLEVAKTVLASFDIVLIFEDKAEMNLLKLQDFFGTFEDEDEINLSKSHDLSGGEVGSMTKVNNHVLRNSGGAQPIHPNSSEGAQSIARTEVSEKPPSNCVTANCKTEVLQKKSSSHMENIRKARAAMRNNLLSHNLDADDKISAHLQDRNNNLNTEDKINRRNLQELSAGSPGTVVRESRGRAKSTSRLSDNDDMEAVFQEENKLDIELYQFARELSNGKKSSAHQRND